MVRYTTRRTMGIKKFCSSVAQTMVPRWNIRETQAANSSSSRWERNDRLEVWGRWRFFFPLAKVAGVGVAYGYKGKGILIHSITDANGMPVVAITTPANGDERQQVLPMLAQKELATGKPGNPKRRPKTLAADKGYDARWLRKRLRTKGIRPQIKKRQQRGKKPKGRPIKDIVPRYQQERSFSSVSTQV